MEKPLYVLIYGLFMIINYRIFDAFGQYTLHIIDTHTYLYYPISSIYLKNTYSF